MKRKRILALLGTALVLAIAITLAAVLIPSWTGAQASADTPLQTSGTAVPAPVTSPSVIVEGRLLPVRHSSLSMSAGGIVAEILAHEGDTLAAGDVILRLRNEQQQAAVAQAEAALASAQASLGLVQAGARAQEIAAAQAGLDGAQARLARMQEGTRPQEIAATRASLEAAKATLQRLYDGPDKNVRIAAEAELSNAEAAMAAAQAAYDPIAGRPDAGMLPQSLQLQQATNNLQAAKARYDVLFAAPEAYQVAQARAQVKQAEANLDRMLKPATANEIAEAQAAVRQAQAQSDLLTAGAPKEQIAVAQAAVDQARAALQLAQAILSDTELRAPFAGALAALYVAAGEQAIPGAPVAELGDLSQWQVETSDLAELDITRVQEGQPVTLTFDAIPGLVLQGMVVRIQSLGVDKVGDVTYTVVIHPEQADPRLRWNMTAVVTIAYGE
jgi:HlyD family secretion protein